MSKNKDNSSSTDNGTVHVWKGQLWLRAWRLSSAALLLQQCLRGTSKPTETHVHVHVHVILQQ